MYQAFLSETTPGSGIGRPRGHFWRNNQMFMNILNPGGQGDFRTDTVDKTLNIMDKIYSTAPVERQKEVARQLAIENPDLAPQMSYEARFSGHVAVCQAIDDSGKVAYMNAGNPLESVDAWRKNERKEMFEASDVAKSQLVSKWLDDNQQAYDRTNLLFQAAVQGDHQVVKMLVEAHVSPHLESVPSIMPLHAACFNGNLECAKILYESGIDVDFKDEFGGTPLMRAAVGNRPDIVKWLLDNGADPSCKQTSDGGYDALTYGAGQDHRIVQLLLDAGAHASPDAIKAAASYGREAAFDLLLVKAGFPDPDAVMLDRAGDETIPERFNEEQLDGLCGALSVSGASGSSYIVRRLLRYLSISGATDSLNARSLDFMHDLANAVLSSIAADDAELLELLLCTYIETDLGFSEGSESKEGLLPSAGLINKCLQEAAETNALKCVRLLLENFGAEVSPSNLSGQVPALHRAACEGHVEMIRMLVTEFKADIHQSATRSATGPTALWSAISKQQEEAARALLELGGPVDLVDDTRLNAAESTGVKAEQEGPVRAWIAANSDHQSSQVRLLNAMDESWNTDSLERPSEMERFLCLEFPDGWKQFLAARKVDEEPKAGG